MAAAPTIVVPGALLGSEATHAAGAGTLIRDGKIYSTLLGTVHTIPPVAAAAPASAATASSAASSATSATAAASLPVVAVVRESSPSAALVPEIGTVVTGRVTRITAMTASVDILVVGGLPVPGGEPFNGVLRKENVRESEVDKVVMEEAVRWGPRHHHHCQRCAVDAGQTNALTSWRRAADRLRHEHARPTGCFCAPLPPFHHDDGVVQVRPGDLLSAVVLSLGDARSYLLGTARPDLGVIYARDDATGEALVPVSFDEMENPTTGKRERRKVAKPTL